MKGLRKWFAERWVNLARPKKGGGYEPCGREEAKSEGYPKCVPAAKAARMSEPEKKSAVERKRTAVRKAGSIRKPTMVSTLARLNRAKRRK